MRVLRQPQEIKRLILLLLVVTTSLQAQDNVTFPSQWYLGTWTGLSTQQPGAARSLYAYTLVFEKTEQNRLMGRAYVCFADDTTQRGEILLEAMPTDTGLVVQYTKTVLNHAQGNWCLKRMVLCLREEGDRDVLSGPWTAPSCPAGFSTVSRAHPLLEQPIARAAVALHVIKTLEVQGTTITIMLWDDQQEDGDVLSLQLDGEYLLQHFALKKEKTSLVLELSPGEHILSIEAENLGRIPPNTAALMVDDGTVQRRITLRADVHYREGITIKVP